jgi:hypothetical protein
VLNVAKCTQYVDTQQNYTQYNDIQHDTQHNNTRHFDSQHNNTNQHIAHSKKPSIMKPSITTLIAAQQNETEYTDTQSNTV